MVMRAVMSPGIEGLFELVTGPEIRTLQGFRVGLRIFLLVMMAEKALEVEEVVEFVIWV